MATTTKSLVSVLLVALAAGAVPAPAMANPYRIKAARGLARHLKQQHPPRRTGLRFVRGKKADLGQHAGDLGQYSRLPDVKLVIPKNGDIEAIARTLAAGRKHGGIARRIKKRVRKGQRRIPLGELLGGFMRKHLNKGIDRANIKNHWAGAPNPNCFHAALTFGSDRAKPRYVGPGEFKRRLRKEYRMLQPGEKMQYGDVVVSWGVGKDYKGARSADGKLSPWHQEPHHTTVYLAPNLMYAKGSNTPEVPYAFEPYSGTLSYYHSRGGGERLLTVHRPNRAEAP